MYGVKGCLKFGKNFISSEQGTQQGDPMGPVLFSIALKILVDKLDSKLLWMLFTLRVPFVAIMSAFRGVLSLLVSLCLLYQSTGIHFGKITSTHFS